MNRARKPTREYNETTGGYHCVLTGDYVPGAEWCDVHLRYHPNNERCEDCVAEFEQEQANE